MRRRGVGTVDAPALRRCINVTPDEFAADYWSQRPLLSESSSLPGSFEDLLTLDAVDELVSRRGLRTPFLRVAKDGDVIDARRYTASGGAGAEVADQVADDKLLALFLDGATLVLQGLHRLWPALIDFAGQLTSDLGHPVQVNAYVTPPSSQGFSAHYDVHDVFVLQVAGEKRWRIHPPVLRDPLRSQPWTDRRAEVAAAAATEPAIDTVLCPGDALYLPRGYLHAAEALGATSAHLTVGVQPVTRRALLDALVRLGEDDPELRGSLPLGLDLADPEALAPHLADTVAALSRRFAVATAQDVAPVVSAAVRLRSRPAPVSPLATASVVAALDLDVVLERRAHQPCSVRQSGDGIDVALADRTVHFPAAAAPAVRAVLGGERLRIRDLPGLDDAERLVVARRLLRETLAVPVRA